MIEYLSWSPDRDTFILTMLDLINPITSTPLAEIDPDTGNLIPSEFVRIDEIGSIEKEPGVYDDNGNELTPPVLVEGHHVNLVAYGKLAELLETNGGWEAIFSLLGVMTEVDSENGVPEGWQGSSGMRIYPKDFVKNPVRIWA